MTVFSDVTTDRHIATQMFFIVHISISDGGDDFFRFPNKVTTFGNVQVEEVTVEDRLDTAGDDGDQVEEALEVVAIDPVEEVEGAVDSESE